MFRRPVHWGFHVAAALSLVLGLAAAVMDVRSYAVHDEWGGGISRRFDLDLCVDSVRGQLWLLVVSDDVTLDWQLGPGTTAFRPTRTIGWSGCSGPEVPHVRCVTFQAF